MKRKGNKEMSAAMEKTREREIILAIERLMGWTSKELGVNKDGMFPNIDAKGI